MNHTYFYSLNDYLRKTYGKKMYKISLNAGMSCPNRDGTLSRKGCIFCSEGGSGDFAESPLLSITKQIELGKEKVKHKIKNNDFIAYFQAYTNTYAPVEYLEKIFMEAINHPDIRILSIATRPDCLSEEILSLLERLNRIKPVWVELGLQTIHEETARYIRRGYRTEVYLDAVRRLKAAGLEVVTHIIIGLPGETAQMAVETTRAAVAAGTDGIKFHLLHVLKGTDLAKEYEKGKFSCLTLEEYGAILKQCVEILPEHTVVHRITGDGAKKDLLAPLWSADKKRVLNYLNQQLE